MEITEIHLENQCSVITANNVMLAKSSFINVNMTDVTISDANLSDLQIEGAQLGGAVFANIGMYPEDHPMYDPALEQRPLLFNNCDLHNSTIANCDLRGIKISACNLEGMTIDGVLVSELLKLSKSGSN